MCGNLIKRKIYNNHLPSLRLKQFGHVGSVLIFKDLDIVSILLSDYQTFFFTLVLGVLTYIENLPSNLLDSCRFLFLSYKFPV